MTPEQFDRWLDFATRMARVVYRGRRPKPGCPGVRWVTQQVKSFILNDVPECDRVCIRDWDGSDPYPEGHEFHRIERKSGCHFCSKDKQNHFVPGPGCDKCEGGWYVQRSHPCGVGDMMREWETETLYYHWRGYLTPQEQKLLDEGVRGEGGSLRPLTDEEREGLRDAVCDRWSDPVRACVRAGLDVASSPSAGVAGITAGQVRQMFKSGKVPDWVKDFFEGHETHVVTGEIPGVGLLTKKVRGKRPNRKFKTRFDSFHNSHEVWL